MIEHKHAIMRLIRLCAYPEKKIQIESLVYGLEMGTVEARKTIENLANDNEITIKGGAIYF